jgi:hypothetical protein
MQEFGPFLTLHFSSRSPIDFSKQKKRNGTTLAATSAHRETHRFVLHWHQTAPKTANFLFLFIFLHYIINYLVSLPKFNEPDLFFAIN